MTPPAASEDPSPPPTHYDVLALPRDFATAQPDPTALLKGAYRRALLRHHPDKTAPDPAPPSYGARFSVDQIALAFAVLSSPARRAAYDGALALGPAQAPAAAAAAFRTGVEAVDLDDLAHDAGAGEWHRACRCGNARGYVVAESDLEAAADEGELLVGCMDCSLWLRVHFAVLQDGEAEGGAAGAEEGEVRVGAES